MHNGKRRLRFYDGSGLGFECRGGKGRKWGGRSKVNDEVEGFTESFEVNALQCRE